MSNVVVLNHVTLASDASSEEGTTLLFHSRKPVRIFWLCTLKNIPSFLSWTMSNTLSFNMEYLVKYMTDNVLLFSYPIVMQCHNAEQDWIMPPECQATQFYSDGRNTVCLLFPWQANSDSLESKPWLLIVVGLQSPNGCHGVISQLITKECSLVVFFHWGDNKQTQIGTGTDEPSLIIAVSAVVKV